mmetsp:Transcript_39941/g.87187  ORF Transcript_39941/g.87187 Transcript_39941/m.87187 type:complete len:368 (+) Transcript_39941:90-1193(+)
MAPKKRRCPAQRARTRRVIERDILTDIQPRRDRPSADEVCSACLLPIDSDCKVGLIDSCTHLFHYECVERWAQTENTCPQCKQRFFWLAAYSSSGKRESLERVELRDQEGQEDDDYEDITICERCREVGNEAMLLLCDGMNGTCNAAYHCTCVGLTEVPHDSWFCPDCVDRGFDTDAQGKRGRQEPNEHAVPGHVARGSAAPAPESAPASAPATSLASARSVIPEGAAVSLDRAPPEPRAKAIEAPAAEVAAEVRAEAAPLRRRLRGALPAHVRLSALACVSPAVQVPTFQTGHSGGAQAGGVGTTASVAADTGQAPEVNSAAEQPVGLFASFARRRRRCTSSEASAASFIALAPTFEDDFFGKVQR